MSVRAGEAVGRRAAGVLQMFYAPAADAGRWLADDRVIALIRFANRTALSANDPREVSIALPLLGPQDLVEVWQTPAPAESGREKDLFYAADPEMLFGHLLMEESQAGGIASTTRAGYGQILRAIEALGYPCLVRIWNYFPAINVEADGLERYRAFCVGRYGALASAGLDEQRLAAASAIGTHAPGLLIYFIAAKEPPRPIENPRQVSAYRYPPLYGPRTPLFSRAVVKRWSAGTHLYISGTASVVGHRTCHEGNRAEQVRETFRNVEALIGEALTVESLAIGSARELKQLKIYVRESPHTEVEQEVARLFGDSLPRVYLQADICRAGLLLEIDALYSEEQSD
jgi:chorismate lyase/3-hydroxybenzoate synthase